jgi:hypothetical protein
VGESGARPAGLAVGRSLVIPSGLVYEALRDAVAAVESVHGDGNLPHIPVALRSLGPTEGRFEVEPATGMPIRIVINSATRSRLAMLHEIGHFLDYAGIGTPNRYASNAASALKSWRRAIRSSRAVEQLNRMRETGVFEIDRPDGPPEKQPVDVSFVDYLLLYNELWARGYAQFIASRSGHPSLRADLDARRSRRHDRIYYPRFWDDQDFVSVGQATEQLFRRLGWIA